MVGEYATYPGKFENNDFESQLRYCHELNSVNNDVSSLIVRKIKSSGTNGAAFGVAGAAKGFWYGLTSSFGVEQTYTVGISNSLAYVER